MPAKKASLSIEPRFRINGSRSFSFGPGKADLLEQIERTGSISKAAKAMGMSYMRAWTLVKSLEKGLSEPLVQRLRGGHDRGGAALTTTGRELLMLYRQLETDVQPSLKQLEKKLQRLLSPSPGL